MEREEERALLNQARNGDERAFLDLVSGYQLRLHRKALSMVGLVEDAEDVVQETLITAYRALNSFRGDSGFFTWIYRILINKARDHIRKSSRRSSELSTDEQVVGIQDNRISIEKNHELSEEGDYLKDKINSLERKYRIVLLMRYYEELSYQEMAEIVKVNVGTIKSRLYKARELLKRSIIENGRGESYFEQE